MVIVETLFQNTADTDYRLQIKLIENLKSGPLNILKRESRIYFKVAGIFYKLPTDLNPHVNPIFLLAN